jgi:hypothetical protein
MPSMQKFYLLRAAEARQDAADATLINVRGRFLAAASTWSSLAARAGRVDTMLAARPLRGRAMTIAAAAASPQPPHTT